MKGQFALPTLGLSSILLMVDSDTDDLQNPPRSARKGFLWERALV